MTKKGSGQHIMSNAELKASMEKEGLSLPSIEERVKDIQERFPNILNALKESEDNE